VGEVADPQLHGPWYAEVTWGLENDVAWSRDAVTHADEGVLEVGEVSGTVLMGSEWSKGQADDDEGCLLVH